MFSRFLLDDDNMPERDKWLKWKEHKDDDHWSIAKVAIHKLFIVIIPKEFQDKYQRQHSIVWKNKTRNFLNIFKSWYIFLSVFLLETIPENMYI